MPAHRNATAEAEQGPAKRTARTRGLTLLETLAVVVILAMASSAALVGLHGMSAEARLQRVLSDWRLLDGRTRVAAQLASGQLHTVAIVITSDGAQVDVAAGAAGRRPPVDRLTLPRSAHHTATIGGRLVSRVPVDRRGCSDDYEVEVLIDLTKRLLRFDGLSGCVRVEETR